MTTTPATNEIDLDELRDLNEAATPAPWQVDFAIGDGTHEISAAPDVLLCYCVGTDHDVMLIVKMRNALPVLLDELANARREVAEAFEHGLVTASMGPAERERLHQTIAEAERERDAARAELAKTRAELDHLRRVLDAANETTAAAQQIVTAALADGTARVNPTTTAEPADEPLPTIAESEAKRLANLRDCTGTTRGGLHCTHYQEGDSNCHDCGRPNYCPDGGVVPDPRPAAG